VAVDPDRLDEIAGAVAAVYREAETALAALIAQHLAGDLDSDMQAPAWAQKKLAAVAALRRSAQAVIAGLQAAGPGAVRDAAAAAFREGWSSALAELPKSWFPASGLGQDAQAAIEQLPGFAAVEALANAVYADIGEKSRNILRDVLDAYRKVITAATARTVTGVQTRRQAAQAAWQALRDRGVTGFTDRAGRRWKLSSYVEMAVRTVTQRAAVQGQTDRLATLGVQLVMVSNAPQECVLCRPYEGQVLRLDAGPTGAISVPHELTDAPMTVEIVATLAEAQLRGLFHPNCRHSVSAYLPGVSKPAPQPTADPDGDRARQQQRALEREIRRHKTAEAAALGEEDRKAARRKVAGAQARMREHLKANPTLKRLPYREAIGAGNIPPKGKGGPAGAIGPDLPPTLDGGPGSAPKPTGRAPDEQAVTVNDEHQADLLADVAPGPEPVDPLGGMVLKPKPRGVQDGDFAGLRRVGPQGGSNPGGLYEDADGVRWYVKAQRSEEHARNETAASALYREAGVDVPEVHLGRGTPDLSGDWHTASRVLDGDQVSDPDAVREQLREGYGVDAWLANWDIVGATFDNVIRTPDGKVARIDLGGSILFRAQGGPKGARFGETVDEWLSLRDRHRAPQASRVFTGMSPVEQLAAVQRVTRIKVGRIREIVAAAGLPKSVADLLVARRRDLAKRLPALREQAKRQRAWEKAHKSAVKGRAGLATPPLQLTYTDRRLLPRPAGWSSSRLFQVTAAVADYRGSGYRQINGYLRHGAGDRSDTVARIDEAMELSTLPKAVGVHRGILDPAKVFGAAWNDVDVTGLEWVEKGYSSTTVDVRVAREFSSGGGGRVMMRVVLPKGTRAIRLSDMAGPGQPLGGISTEAEVLGSRQLRYRVVADHGFDEQGTRHVDVEVIQS